MIEVKLLGGLIAEPGNNRVGNPRSTIADCMHLSVGTHSSSNRTIK
jgi:hypothetical protein